jgi:hypothetical protein
MFVLMQIHGFPVSAKFPDELGLGNRFWYWSGVSGRTYIHSIYPADACPPSPGAVYLAVRNRHGHREVLAAGRFSSCWDGSLRGYLANSRLPEGTDEIHVHLLARDNVAMNAVLDDLAAAIEPDTETAAFPGFRESPQRLPAFG